MSPDDATPVTSDTNAATPTPGRTRRASDTAGITEAVTMTLVSPTAAGRLRPNEWFPGEITE